MRGRIAPEAVSDLFETATDEDRWPQFSVLLGRAAGIEAVSVWITENGTMGDASAAPIYRSFQEPYRAHFARIDPWAAGLARHPLETVMLAHEHIREDELVKTEFYADFARPGGMLRPIGVKMQLAPGVFATMGSEQPFAKKLFEPRDKLRVERLVPYVKRVLQLRRRFSQARALSQAKAAAIDMLAFAVVVCDASGHIAAANAAAEALARAGAGIRLHAHGIGALAQTEALRLRALIRDAAEGGAGGVIRLTGMDGTTQLLGLVTPLPRRSDGERGIGYALVALRPARDSATFSAAMLASLFGLSRAQAEIALAVFNGQTPEEIALARGIKITTLRSHLEIIFHRTGAESQRALVRLLAMLPPLR